MTSDKDDLTFNKNDSMFHLCWWSFKNPLYKIWDPGVIYKHQVNICLVKSQEPDWKGDFQLESPCCQDKHCELSSEALNTSTDSVLEGSLTNCANMVILYRNHHMTVPMGLVTPLGSHNIVFLVIFTFITHRLP